MNSARARLALLQRLLRRALLGDVHDGADVAEKGTVAPEARRRRVGRPPVLAVAPAQAILERHRLGARVRAEGRLLRAVAIRGVVAVNEPKPSADSTAWPVNSDQLSLR